MLRIFKEKTVHTFMLAFSVPFLCLILLHNLFFPPFGVTLGVTRVNNHITSHPWCLPYKNNVSTGCLNSTSLIDMRLDTTGLVFEACINFKELMG